MGIWTGYQMAKADKNEREKDQATRDLAERRLELMEEQFAEGKRQTTLDWISKYQDASGERETGAKAKAATLQKLRVMGLDARTSNYLIDSGEAGSIITVYDERVGKTLSQDWIPSLMKMVSANLDDETSVAAKALAVKSALLSAEDQTTEEGQRSAFQEAIFNVISGEESGIENFDEELARSIFSMNQPQTTIGLPPIGNLTTGSKAINSDETKKIRLQIIEGVAPILGEVFMKDSDGILTGLLDQSQIEGPVSGEKIENLISNTVQKIIDKLERVGEYNPSDVIEGGKIYAIEMAQALKKNEGKNIKVDNTPTGGFAPMNNNPPPFVTGGGLTEDNNAFDPYGSIVTERTVS